MEFHIVGASRCYTSSLYAWLNRSREVMFPSFKEGFHISTSDPNLFYGTANPRFFTHKHILNFLDVDTKLIVLVRNPVERAYSHWHYFRQVIPSIETDKFNIAIEKNFDRIKEHGLESSSPCLISKEDIIKKDRETIIKFFEKLYLETGLYNFQLGKFRSFKNKLILNCEDLLKQETLVNIKEFLEIDSLDVKIPLGHLNQNVNESRLIDPNTLNSLIEFYLSDVTTFNKNYGFELIV